MLVQFLAITGSMIISIAPIPKATGQTPNNLPENLHKTTLIKTALSTPQQEEQNQFLQQVAIAAGATIAMVSMSWGVRRLQKRLIKDTANSIPLNSLQDQPITILNQQLNQQQQQHLQEVKTRLFQLAQAGIWVSGSLIILGLFPATQALQIGIITIAKIPIKLIVVAVGTYVVLRFTYAIIDHFTSTIVCGVRGAGCRGAGVQGRKFCILTPDFLYGFSSAKPLLTPDS